MKRLAVDLLTWLTLIAFVGFLALALSGRALAQPAETRALALEVARVAFNEAGDSRDDLAMIWQIVELRRATVTGRRNWLAQHSRCVSGLLPESLVQRRGGNCAWTRELNPAGSMPRSWPHSPGYWTRVRPRWLAHLHRSLQHATATDRLPWLCPDTVGTWDGRTWIDEQEARGRHYIECKGDTRNVAYAAR